MITHLPSSIRVGAVRYDLERSDIPEESNRFAETTARNQKIRFGTTTTPRRMAECGLHELLHAIWFEYGISDEDKEERTVNVLATGLAQVLQDLGVWPEELRVEGEDG